MKKSGRFNAVILSAMLAMTLGTVTACGKTTVSTASESAMVESQSETGAEAGSESAGESKSAQTQVSGVETEILLADGASEVNGEGAEVDGDTITITAAGTYTISGSLSDGQIVVDVDEGDVKLILSDAQLTCSTGDAIFIRDADSAVVEAADGTKNTLTAGTQDNYEAGKAAVSETQNTALESRVLLQDETADTAVTVSSESAEAETVEETEEETVSEETSDAAEETEEDTSDFKKSQRAVIFADCDLTVTGSGELVLNGYINNGLQSKGNLAIESVALTITALNDGVKSSGNMTLSSGAYTVSAYGDAFQSEGDLTVSDGSYTVKTGDGAENSMSKSMQQFGGQMPQAGNAMPQGDTQQSDSTDQQSEDASRQSGGPQVGGGMPSGEMPSGEMPSGEMPQGGAGGGMPSMGGYDGFADMDSTDNSVSQKAFKAEGILTISGGSLQIDAADDGIHSNTDVEIDGGEITIASGDDGVHAEADLVIDDGAVTVTQSNEGLEGSQIIVNGGTLDITASDDGLNAAGDGETILLEINGGDVHVNAGGDGLDSNCDLVLNGGTVFVEGPSDNGNSAIDIATEYGGTFVINGGLLTAYGSSGMAENADSTSTQNSILFALSESFTEGTEVSVTDSEGNVITSFTASKSANCVMVSSDAIKTGETYTFTYGSQSETITVDNVNTTNCGNGGFGAGGNFGGRR